MSFIPKPHEIYKHFKGKLYQVTAIAEHTETGEQLVVYQALYGDFKTYARPLAMFTERVDREKYPEAAQEFRFELLTSTEETRADEDSVEAAEPESRAVKSPVEAAEPESQAGEDSVEAAEPEPQAGKEPVEAAGPESQAGKEPVEAAEPESRAGEDPGDELSLDPLVLEFLDADGYEERLNILAGLHHRITDDMITTMAIACDLEVNNGDIEERYESLKACLLTLERYECNRIR